MAKTRRTKVGIPPRTVERINAIFRPVDDVCECRVMTTFLDFLEEQETEPEKIAVLAYALSVRHSAHLSGPETPDSAYPEFPAEQHIHHEQMDGVHEGLKYTLTMLDLEHRQTATTVARHALKFLEPFRARTARLHTLAHIFDDLTGKVEDPTIPLSYDRGLPDDEYRAVIWKYRENVDTMVATMEKAESITGMGEALLTIAAAIPDERERACVVGFALQGYMRLQNAKGTKATSLDDAVQSLIASIIGTRPAHVCSVVIVGGKPR